MINVGLVEKNNFGGIQFYRTITPLARLHREGKINLTHYSDVSYITLSDMIKSDVIVIPRPYHKSQFKVIKMAANIGVPVVVDFDDNLFKLPATNKAVLTWTQENMDISASSINIADAVIVSTHEIKNTFHGLEPFKDKKIEVVYNAFPTKIERAPNPISGKIKVGWRGSETHYRDITVYEKIIDRLDQSDKYELEFFGCVFPWKDWKVKTHRKLAFADYLTALKNAKLNVLLVPLEDIPFNHAKSNIAWIEATFAGAMAITNLKGRHWNAKGIEHDHNVLLSKNLQSTILNRYRESKETINKNFNLDLQNKKRLKVLTEAADKIRMI